MVKRYLYTSGAFFFLLLIYIFSLVPFFFIRKVLSHDQYILILSGWAVVALLCLLPAMSLIIRHIWFFKGTGKTLEMEAMRQKLFSINAMDCPVQVIKKKRSLIVTWNHSDWKWCDYMSCAGMKTLYELCLHFEPATNTVNISDKIRSVYFIVCPDEVKTGLFSWPRPLLNLYTGEKWTIEKYIDCIPPDFSFTPQEIKSPVLGTLRKHGWNIRFHYF